MKYMGSKARFTKELLPIILRNRTKDQYYVEPFCGGCNMICEVKGNRIANDIHPYLIPMWKAFVYEGFDPDFIERDTYKNIRLNKENYPPPPCWMDWLWLLLLWKMDGWICWLLSRFKDKLSKTNIEFN